MTEAPVWTAGYRCRNKPTQTLRHKASGADKRGPTESHIFLEKNRIMSYLKRCGYITHNSGLNSNKMFVFSPTV